MNSLFDEFRTICSHLNQVGITPTLMGSLGFEYRSNDDLQLSFQPLYLFKILIVIVLISIRILGRSLVNHHLKSS